jgi:amino acid adenylation domain-containing protein
MLLEAFDRWVRARPDSIAVWFNGEGVSYAELHALAKCVAAALIAAGAGPGERVVLYQPKDSCAIASMLGVLYSGAAYVPIDPRAPVARVQQIIESCEPCALLGNRTFIQRISGVDPRVRRIDTGSVANPPNGFGGDSRESPRISGDTPAYVLYTSGSTGVPKGVVITHEGARSFVDWACRQFALNAHDRLTNFAPLSFDLSVFDIFAALSSGASVDLIGPELLLRPRELVARLAEWKTTTLYAVPSTITLLQREGGLDQVTLPALQRVLYAGEAFPIASLIAAMAALPRVAFYNLFGPTETNVCTFHALRSAPNPEDTEVPIGRACDHLTVELLDDQGGPVPVGQEGELCVAGPALMKEYFREPQATAATFHPPDRFEDGRRRYRTGDRAICDESGQFWFRGRCDRLVKRRGYRVEPGEIEVALRRHPRVIEAAVVSESDGTETRLRAFVTLDAIGQVSALILRAHCGSLLPAYMVPDSVEVLQTLPRTLTGKVDLQSLRGREHL